MYALHTLLQEVDRQIAVARSKLEKADKDPVPSTSAASAEDTATLPHTSAEEVIVPSDDKLDGSASEKVSVCMSPDTI